MLFSPSLWLSPYLLYLSTISISHLPSPTFAIIPGVSYPSPYLHLPRFTLPLPYHPFSQPLTARYAYLFLNLCQSYLLLSFYFFVYTCGVINQWMKSFFKYYIRCIAKNIQIIIHISNINISNFVKWTTIANSDSVLIVYILKFGNMMFALWYHSTLWLHIIEGNHGINKQPRNTSL